MTNIRSKRIEVADALRGFSLLGIIIVHCILQFNNYPDKINEGSYIIRLIDPIVNYLSLLLIAGKAQGIFAILFGFSFFIQYENQRLKGKNFTNRFLWRMFILFIIGNINSLFFLGEILVQFSILGVLLPFFIKLKTKTLMVIATIMLLMPIHWIYLIINSTGLYNPFPSIPFHIYPQAFETLKSGTLLETFYSNFRFGEINILLVRLFDGSAFKLIAFFMVGIIIGRNKAFLDTGENIKMWKKIFIINLTLSFFLFFVLRFINSYGFQPIINDYYNTILIFCIISAFVLIYYLSVIGHKILSVFAPAGKMSLTVYFTQSIIGSFIFYHWGLDAGMYINHTYLLLLAIAIFFTQSYLCFIWLKYYKQGPIELLWKKLTWIDFNSQVSKIFRK